ncbi:DUF5388 domain-containing protein [Periweissella beninensis]|uniref:Uncharacterized protein n=1 Tax=Periweissella beninensis TaxID=504936 RepID=A0ABT0VEZ7_9LACO|nr:DUF5388 domain-containing protein [Periweissella beninensis]MBM7545001.1 Arc/MetJ-type ribon-helix-helix transcriptional regulator [Periweissella beninensis]MCM2436422.1 hypothetical protein [Periweissella beninensis]MCT4397051.1 hypothetical protein [Periweissella beninensis]
MASLIKNPNKDNNNKKVKIIERQAILKPANSFTTDDLKTDDSKEKIKISGVDRVTFDTSVRMNNHIKNQLQAMTLIGAAKNQSEAIESLLVEWLNSIDSDTERMFKFQVEMLEKKDVVKFNSKK